MANICIVLNYNDADETIRFCNNLRGYSCIDKIVIVDNKSTDNSVQRLKSIETEKIVLLCAPENKGYAAGNNVGLQYVLENKYDGNVIISNPDVDIAHEDLVRILSVLDMDENIGMSTGLIYTNNRLVSNFGWRVPKAGELLAHNFFTLHKLLTILNHSFYLQKDDISRPYLECNCVPGCFFCLRIDVLQKIGLLDERTFLFGEENILGYQLWNNGYKTVISTESKVIHHGGHSIKKSRTKKKTTRKYAENSLQLYVREYLKCGKTMQIWFHWMFWLAMYEQDCVVIALRFFERLKKKIWRDVC